MRNSLLSTHPDKQQLDLPSNNDCLPGLKQWDERSEVDSPPSAEPPYISDVQFHTARRISRHVAYVRRCPLVGKRTLPAKIVAGISKGRASKRCIASTKDEVDHM